MWHRQKQAPANGQTRLPAQPHVAVLHGAMLLSGFGTVFLGPVLPVLTAAAHTNDSGSGLFFTAQFIGSFLGGVTTTARLWRSLLRGCTAAAAGFLLLSLCVSRHAALAWYAIALLPLGFGVGQALTSVNLLTAQRFRKQQGAAISLVNFSWSLGAVLTPTVLGYLLKRNALPHILLGACGLFCLALVGTAWNSRQPGQQEAALPASPGVGGRLPLMTFLFFASLLFTYGGVETSLGGWTTTFGQRYGSGSSMTGSAAGAFSTTALWLGLTVGRALVPVLLPRIRERTLLQAAVVAATLATFALSRSSGGVEMVVTCVLLGLSLAPWFPLVLTSMIAAGVSASQVGTIIAVSGIGAAILPLVEGALSRSTGSLRVALLVPIAGLIWLLIASFRSVTPTFRTAPGHGGTEPKGV